MQINMHKLSSQTLAGNQKKFSHTLKQKLKKHEANLQKWNFDVNDPAIQRIHSARNSPNLGNRRAKSFDPNSMTKTPYAKKQTGTKGRESSLSVKPATVQTITKTKAKIEKIERLKSLYVQK